MTLSASHCARDGEIGLLAPGISSQTFKGQQAATAMNAVHCVEIKKTGSGSRRVVFTLIYK